MAESEQDRIFRTKVIPIMNKVRNELQDKMADELKEHTSSFAGLMASAIGPDGGMSARQAQMHSLRYTGEWNSKTAEDYIEMVKKELQLQHIIVDSAMEKKMIDKMIQDKIPRSSIEYILKKAATNTIFYLPQEVAKSPLEHHMDAEAEKRYNPSEWEKNTGIILGSVTDLACMGGAGGGWKTAATWVGGDFLLSKFSDKQEDRSDIPSIVRPGCEEQYRQDQEKMKKQEEEKPQTSASSVETTPEQEEPVEEEQPTEEQTSPKPEQTNMDGWQGLLTSFGLNGISDIGHNIGYVLAMLPDMLVGLFTGKTKSINLKDNMMPIASIVTGMFVKNPILKMILIAMGGLNLLNKAGHETLDDFKAQQHPETGTGPVNYRIYPDEPLDPRIVNPQIKSNCLIAIIDKVPCTITLPDKVVNAYQQGALPLNTLANAILAKNDQMRQIASENYEAGERQTVARPLAQR